MSDIEDSISGKLPVRRILAIELEDTQWGSNIKPKIYKLGNEEGMFLFVTFRSRCKECGHPMVEIGATSIWGGFDIEKQLLAAGVRRKSKSTQIIGELCSQCDADAKGTFTCRICLQQKTSDRLYTDSRTNDPVCLDCYETVPAKKWDEFTKYEEWY